MDVVYVESIFQKGSTMYLGRKLSKARPGRPATVQAIHDCDNFFPENSPAKISQTKPGDFGYFGKHLIKSPGDKKVPGRIAGRPDPAKKRPYGRSPSGTVRQPFKRAKQRDASRKV